MLKKRSRLRKVHFAILEIININGIKLNTKKKSLKRWFIIGIIASLSASALIGIVTVLQGSFDEIDWKILGTTLAIGVFSITSLSSLGLLESPKSGLRTFSLLSLCLSGIAFALVAYTVWANWDSDLGSIMQYASVSTVLAISAAHGALLLGLRNRGNNFSLLVSATLVFITLVAGMLSYLILASDVEAGDAFYRALAVFAILDVLGTILTPILAKFMKVPEPDLLSAPDLIHPDKP